MHDIQYYQEDNPLTMSMLFRITAIHDGKKVAAQRYVTHELLASGMPDHYIWDSLRHALQKEVDKYEDKKALNPDILELQDEYNKYNSNINEITKAVYQAKISEQLLKDSALMKQYYNEMLKDVPNKPSTPPVDTYKERAPSEFEGVELDETLWNDEGDLA